jgi:hypothetical protein
MSPLTEIFSNKKMDASISRCENVYVGLLGVLKLQYMRNKHIYQFRNCDGLATTMGLDDRDIGVDSWETPPV